MNLTLVADDKELVRVRCQGDIREVAYFHPLSEFLGPECYGRKVLLGLEEVSYIDSNGVGWLIRNHKQFQQAGGMLILHSLQPRVQQILQFLHLSDLLCTVADEEAARALALGDGQ
jgi:anti-anti-sigma factor